VCLFCRVVFLCYRLWSHVGPVVTVIIRRLSFQNLSFQFRMRPSIQLLNFPIGTKDSGTTLLSRPERTVCGSQQQVNKTPQNTPSQSIRYWKPFFFSPWFALKFLSMIMFAMVGLQLKKNRLVTLCNSMGDNSWYPVYKIHWYPVDILVGFDRNMSVFREFSSLFLFEIEIRSVFSSYPFNRSLISGWYPDTWCTDSQHDVTSWCC